MIVTILIDSGRKVFCLVKELPKTENGSSGINDPGDDAPKRNRRKKTLIAFLAVAGFLALQAVLLPDAPVWITDNGNKIIVTQAIAQDGTSALKPPFGEKEFFPGTFHFQQAPDGTVRSVLPDVFPYLQTPIYRAFGDRGWLVLPILGVLATMWFFLATLEAAGYPGRLRTMLTALALVSAPFLFYGGTVWEMTLGTAFAAAGMYFAVKKQFFAAGLALGLGVWLREECGLILVLGAVTGAIRDWKGMRKWAPGLIAGAAAAGLPLCTMNYWRYGHILGLHGALYYSHNADGAAAWSTASLARRVLKGYGMYWFRFEAWGPANWMRFAPMIPVALLPFAGALRGFARTKRVLLWLGLCGWFAMFAGLLFSRDMIRYAGLNVGLVATCPLFAGFYLTWRDQIASGRTMERAGAVFAGLYCLVVPAILTQTDIGVIWGARHFLPVAGLLFLLSWRGFERLGLLRRNHRAQAALTAVAAVLFLLAGEKALFVQAYAADATERALAKASEEVIVTDVFFLPEMTPRLARERTILMIEEDSDIPEAIRVLRANGVKRFSLVLSASTPYFGTITDAGLETLNETPGLHAGTVVKIRPDDRTFLALDVIPSTLD